MGRGRGSRPRSARRDWSAGSRAGRSRMGARAVLGEAACARRPRDTPAGRRTLGPVVGAWPSARDRCALGADGCLGRGVARAARTRSRSSWPSLRGRSSSSPNGRSLALIDDATASRGPNRGKGGDGRTVAARRRRSDLQISPSAAVSSWWIFLGALTRDSVLSAGSSVEVNEMSIQAVALYQRGASEPGLAHVEPASRGANPESEGSLRSWARFGLRRGRSRRAGPTRPRRRPRTRLDLPPEEDVLALRGP